MLLNDDRDEVFFSADKLYCSDGAWSNPRFAVFDLNDYSGKQISIPDIQIYSISASPTSENLAFSGMQYSTGHIVIGEYDAQDKVTIISSTDSTQKIESLICLN